MANRRTFGYADSPMQPSSPMTPRGSEPMAHERDEMMMPYAEHPETMRRRLTPMVGEVEQRPTSIQALMAMLMGEP